MDAPFSSEKSPSRSVPSSPPALLAGARVALGLALFAAPRRLGRLWLGGATDHPATRVAVRSMGARDAVIGAGALIALRRQAPVRGWLEAGAAADAADALASVMAGSQLPMMGRVAVPAFALGGMAAGAFLARRSSQ